MGTHWTKEQIQTLKRKVCIHREDALIDEKLTKLNLHLNHYERAPLIHTKNDEWKEVEAIAVEINDRLLALQAG